jgi:hypothetical protein
MTSAPHAGQNKRRNDARVMVGPGAAMHTCPTSLGASWRHRGEDCSQDCVPDHALWRQRISADRTWLHDARAGSEQAGPAEVRHERGGVARRAFDDTPRWTPRGARQDQDDFSLRGSYDRPPSSIHRQTTAPWVQGTHGRLSRPPDPLIASTIACVARAQIEAADRAAFAHLQKTAEPASPAAARASAGERSVQDRGCRLGHGPPNPRRQGLRRTSRCR